MSGTAAGVAPAVTDGARAAFVQFSGRPSQLQMDPANPCFQCLSQTVPPASPNYKACGCFPVSDDVRETPAGTGTGGHFSGAAAEIAGDLAWHHDNYLGDVSSSGMTFMEGSLRRMAAIFARDSPLSAGRKRALVLITDGRVQDQMDDLRPLHTAMKADGIELFGLYVRKKSPPSAQDVQAEGVVKELLSPPADAHFHDVEVDEVGNYLASLCDPGGAWGRYVLEGGQGDSGATPVPHYASEFCAAGAAECETCGGMWCGATTPTPPTPAPPTPVPPTPTPPNTAQTPVPATPAPPRPPPPPQRCGFDCAVLCDDCDSYEPQ
eukprot:gene41184-22374_t